MKRFRRLLNLVIKKGFPELKWYFINLHLSKSSDFFMATRGIFILHQIIIDKELKKCSDEIIIGCFAHELSHILKDSLFDTIKMAHNEKYLIERERENDLEVIRRGFGSELLKFIQYHNSKYKNYKKEDGLTEKEIKKLINTL